MSGEPGFKEEWKKDQKAIYCFAICLRLLPFFRCFSERFSWGKVGVVEDAMHDIFIAMDNSELLCAAAIKWTPVLEGHVPDMDDFNSALLPSLGLDSITAVLAMCDYIVFEKDECIYDIEEISHNTSSFVDAQADEFLEFAIPSGSLPYISQEQEFKKSISSIVSDCPDAFSVKDKVYDASCRMAYKIKNN